MCAFWVSVVFHAVVVVGLFCFVLVFVFGSVCCVFVRLIVV